jgi:hypothetical protein
VLSFAFAPPAVRPGSLALDWEGPVLNCPKCGSPRVHRSRTRTFWERFRKNFTHDRVHRCHGCGWRGWGPVTSEPMRPKDQPDHVRPAPNLEAIDVAVTEAQVKQVEKAE